MEFEDEEGDLSEFEEEVLLTTKSWRQNDGEASLVNPSMCFERTSCCGRQEMPRRKEKNE